MKYSLLCASVLLLLGACAANSNSFVTYHLDKGFAGHPINDFFEQYGYPSGEFTVSQGKAYRWTSLGLPSEPNRHVYRTTGGEYQVIDTYKGSTVRQYCELRIIANRDDIILGFAIAVDTDGKYSSSRCSELFTRTYP